MFKKIKTDNFYLYSTEVENFFISDFMIKAPGEYVKAYLLSLMFAGLGTQVDNESLKRQLGMSNEDIENCWEYWEKLGVIKRVNNEDGTYDVVFVNLRELIGSGNIAPSKREESSLDDKDLAKLFKEVQSVTGRMIESREMSEIMSWLDAGINPELMVYCYAYCAQKRKSSTYRYVGTVLKDWFKKGLKTASDAEEYLNESDNRFSMYKAVFNELGFSRNPTAEEKRIMDDWVDGSGYSLDNILEACKQTIGISNPNIKYVDAVLKNSKPQEEKKENIAVKINRIYEEIRKENEEKTRANRSAVFSKIPRIKDIMAEFGETALKQSQAILKHDGIALKEIQNKMKALQDEKAELLRRAGFSEKAVDRIYTCHKCKDTGVLEDGSACSCYAEKLEQLNGK